LQDMINGNITATEVMAKLQAQMETE